jgi:hypothetical protein
MFASSRILLIALAGVLGSAAAPARDLVEFHHAGRDQYFVTVDPGEIQALESGVHPGWVRTGQTLKVFDAGDPGLAGSVPVCRFAGNPARGLGSHFYSAIVAECEAVKVRFRDDWLLEADEVFRVHLPDAAGTCPAGTKAVHRLYNRRADVNHRYTSDRAIVDQMVARGYVAEGVGGPPPVAFCAADPAPVPPPSCVLNASTTTLQLGQPLLLSATCGGTVTRYEWLACAPTSPDTCAPLAECASTSGTCAPVGRESGRVLYSLRATGPGGTGPRAGVVVTWTAAPTSAPACTLTANPSAPYAGGSTLLTANCTQSPTSYAWTGCSGSTGPTCRVFRSTTGTATYAVTAANAVGSSAPAAITLDWQQPPPVGADLCHQFDRVRRIDLVWGGFANTNDPGGGLYSDGVMAARLVVPATATGTNLPGLISIVEFVQAPADRVMTVSRSACDFRGFQPGGALPTDASSMNAPIAWGIGTSPSTMFALAGMPGGHPQLIPGQTYYVNMMNRSYVTGEASCGGEECNVRVTVNPPR